MGNCFCFTCKKSFGSLGIARHRAAHRLRGETCRIQYSRGDVWIHDYSKIKSKDKKNG